jgi:hypothetical protein
MTASEIRYTQVKSTDLTVERLPDGSTAVLDQRSKDVHSLNSSATIAWEACEKGATLAQVRTALENYAGAPVDEEVALSALSQLRKVSLIQPDAPVPVRMMNQARRSTLLRLGLAVPVVVTLALSEQRAYAFYASSRGGGINAGP